MTSLRLAALALSLTTAFLHAPATADTQLPVLPLGTPSLSNLYGLELNQWYVFSNFATAGTLVNGQASEGAGLGLKNFPVGADLTRRIETSQVDGSRQASALALVSPTSLGAAASAHDPANAFGSGTLGVGMSSVYFFAVLDQNVDFRFNIKLDGRLDGSDAHRLSSDVSGAAVAAVTMGSWTGYSNESMQATYHAAGMDPYAEGEALIRELGSLRSTRQTHLDTFGAQTSAVHDVFDVDTSLQVSATGIHLDCNRALSPACGRYAYFLGVTLFTAAQDGGLADFSHTLSIASVSVNGGAALPFNAISPVPEPASAALLVAGLLAVGGTALRRARQMP